MRKVKNHIKDQLCQYCIFSHVEGKNGIHCVIDEKRAHFQSNCEHFSSDLQHRPDLLYYRIQRIEKDYDNAIYSNKSKQEYASILGNTIITVLSLLTIISGFIILYQVQLYEENTTNIYLPWVAYALISFGSIGVVIAAKNGYFIYQQHQKRQETILELTTSKKLIVENLKKESRSTSDSVE